MAPSSIADRVAQCLGCFESIATTHQGLELDRPKEKIVTDIYDELARFKLWSGNIGAHRAGRSSLDHRLRDSSRLREQVARLLEELAKSLDEVKAILSGKATPWDEEIRDSSELDVELKEILKDEEFEFDSELDQLCVDISDIIGSLLRLSLSIRNPAPHDHFMSTEYAKAKYFNDFDVRHVETKYKNANRDLARRLGAAISRRRQYFKYRESHHAKLSRGINFDESCTEAGVKSTVASSVPLRMKDTGISAPAFDELDEDDNSETGISQTSYATTAPDSEKLRIPPLPEQYSKGPFECPFCFTLICVTNRFQWKKHVLSDLRPYTCLFEKCPTANREYGSRHEWMDHVLQRHWKVWKCPGSCEGSWSSEADLKQHLQNLHSDLVNAGDLNAIIVRSERNKPPDEKTQCQLCGEILDSIKEYQRHVGKHQVDLALFALPMTENGADSDPDEMADDNDDELDDDEDVGEGDEISKTEHQGANELLDNVPGAEFGHVGHGPDEGENNREICNAKDVSVENLNEQTSVSSQSSAKHQDGLYDKKDMKPRTQSTPNSKSNEQHNALVQHIYVQDADGIWKGHQCQTDNKGLPVNPPEEITTPPAAYSDLEYEVPERTEVQYAWRCHTCGDGVFLCSTTPICLSCSHLKCDYCLVFTDLITSDNF